jgi:hypothetical protein
MTARKRKAPDKSAVPSNMNQEELNGPSNLPCPSLRGSTDMPNGRQTQRAQICDGPIPALNTSL